MARSTESTKFLATVPMFQGLSEKELRTVAACAHHETYAPGDEVVTQGKAGGPFFVILEGNAELLIDGATQRSLGPGDFFGEMALIEHAPRSGTVRATEPLTTATITSWDFLALLEESWPLCQKVLVELCRRVRQADSGAEA
ncbi:MAG: cyclic nucleotide-binding domain-containing protein [Actinobacteria bacterium]|nr:cyclic nucleotide-binding domain-containing protein [Actinomycetota bacterium]